MLSPDAGDVADHAGWELQTSSNPGKMEGPHLRCRVRTGRRDGDLDRHEKCALPLHEAIGEVLGMQRPQEKNTYSAKRDSRMRVELDFIV